MTRNSQFRPSQEGLFSGHWPAALAVVAAMLLAGPVSAQAPPPEPDFSPPPVPDFMLRKPDKPLTLEEMKRQADEAAARVRAGTRMPMPPAPPATAPTSKGDEAAAK